MWNYSWEEGVFVILCLSCCRCFHTKELFDHFCDILSVGEDKADGTITLIKGPINILVDTGGPSDREETAQWLTCLHLVRWHLMVLYNSTYNLREGEKAG